MGRSDQRLRAAGGVGLAFVIGLTVAVIAFEVVDRMRGSERQPLVPIKERQAAGELEMPVLTADGDGGPGGQSAAGGGAGDLGERGVKNWSLQQQRGKVVVVNYFATWCPPCVAEMPDLVKLAQEYSGRGVVFVGVSLDRDGEQVKGKPREAVLREFSAAHGVDYPILLPAAGSQVMTAEMPIPDTYLYDQQGRLAETVLGGVDLEHMRAWLEELLKESP